MLLGVDVHRAELQARERPLTDAATHRAEEDRAARAQAHRERDRQQQRAEQHQQQGRADDVERALEREVDALEHRRPEFEQRHRLPRHELGAMDQDLHRRGRQAHPHAAPVALIDELDRVVLREVGVGDDDLVDAPVEEHLLEARKRAERAQAVVGQRLGREEADDVDRCVWHVGERVRDVDDVLAAADQHGASLVAGGSQQQSGDALVDRAKRSDVEDRERERAPEQVVAREVFAADDGEDQRHERHLEQRADDAREPRTQRALRVQPGAREQQRRQQVGEGQEVFGAFARVHRLHASVDRFLEHQRREDRERHAGEVERQQRGDARHAPEGRGAQQERDHRRALAADVAIGALDPLRAERRRRARACTSGRSRRRSGGFRHAWSHLATHNTAASHTERLGRRLPLALHGGLRKRTQGCCARPNVFSWRHHRQGTRRRTARSCAAIRRAATPRATSRAARPRA